MERYKKVCKQISEQINPSEEFINDLKMNLNDRVSQEKMKRKSYLSKVAMIFFTLTLISSGAFAMDIGNWLSQLFSNTDESIQIAVENGYVQNVDMDYVENQGIAIKVSSLVIDDNKMNIVFDVKGEIDGELVIKEFFVSTEEESLSSSLKLLNTLYSQEFKSISKNSHILMIKISNLEQGLNCKQNLKIILNNLSVIHKDCSVTDIVGNWECSVDLEEDNFKNKTVAYLEYTIEENEYLKNYKINVTNTGTNIQLYLKENFNRYNLIQKENIYIQTENGKKYLCKDLARINDDTIQMNIPITVYDNIETFYIVLDLENEKLVFNVKKSS